MTWPEMEEADLETFLSLDRPTRHLVLRLLGEDGPSTDADRAVLDAHPNGEMLASWLLMLPAYRTKA